jgi:hypothetical protein
VVEAVRSTVRRRRRPSLTGSGSKSGLPDLRKQ